MNQTNCRFGHTTIYDENKIYIYGGRIKEKNTSILVGLEIYSLKENSFSKPYIQKEPPDRRDHIAIYICNHMLIHGGVGISNEILSDCYLLNLQTLKWIDPPIEQYSPKPKLYGHTCCLVIPYQLLNHKNFNIYKFPEIEINSDIKIKQKGLYIFGGKTKEYGGLTNDLWILIMGKNPFSWMKVNTLGKPPSPRYFHSMDYYEKGNYLIIHGGRNDDLSATSALNDTFVLDLENLGWINVELYNNSNSFKVISRYGHKSTIFSNKLIIFGGMNNNNFIGSSLFIVNLDFYYSVNKKTIEQMNIESIKNNEKIAHGKKMKKIKIELGKLKLGVVVPFNSFIIISCIDLC
jgi:N-acetylneuraminic acid mutarotase